MEKLLQVNNITKIYSAQPTPGLDQVSFDVMKGEFLGIMCFPPLIYQRVEL